jgi:hypothetical protein
LTDARRASILMIESTPDPRRWQMLLACCLLMLAVLTVPSMSLAWEPGTPRLFGANDLAFRLATTVPALLFAAVALAGGVLADLTGRRRVLLIGVTLSRGWWPRALSEWRREQYRRRFPSFWGRMWRHTRRGTPR